MLATAASIFFIALAATAEASTCEKMIHRMLSAQGTRAIKELRLCLARSEKPENCRFTEVYLEDDGAKDRHLSADETALSSRLARCERHAEDKFPRKCEGTPKEFFAPICAEARVDGVFSTKEDLTECLYVEHILEFGNDLYGALYDPSPEVTERCKSEMIKQARLGWRDMVLKNLAEFPKRRAKRLRRHCGNSPDRAETWEWVVDIVHTHAAELRDFRRVDPTGDENAD